MLDFFCSWDGCSMSMSYRFWPSTIATRSSSACVALISMRFIVAFLARCYRAERRGRFVWLYWRLRQRGEGSAAGPVETVPRRGAAVRLFQRYDTTAGRGSACVALFVLQGPAAAWGR